jgi:hypothetical protein
LETGLANRVSRVSCRFNSKSGHVSIQLPAGARQGLHASERRKRLSQVVEQPASAVAAPE